MKIDCHIQDICQICMKNLSVGKQSEGPQWMPNIYNHMQAFVVKTM